MTAQVRPPAAGEVTDAELAAAIAALSEDYLPMPAAPPTAGQVLVVASVGPPLVLAWADAGTAPSLADVLVTSSGDTLITSSGARLLVAA